MTIKEYIEKEGIVNFEKKVNYYGCQMSDRKKGK